MNGGEFRLLELSENGIDRVAFPPSHCFVERVNEQRFACWDQLGRILGIHEARRGNRLDAKTSPELVHEFAFAHAGLAKHNPRTREVRQAGFVERFCLRGVVGRSQLA